MLHKPTGQADIRIRGGACNRRPVSPGRYGSPESKAGCEAAAPAPAG
ncbi:MAG: hypothetical protein K2P78_08240 [Gemmataceae bacterium]|nr:hypothetical protein [Gemmataceae bacterium]